MEFPPPAKTLEDLSRTLLEEPLQVGDPRYVDLSEARGDSARKRLTRVLLGNNSDSFLHFALASHRGSGKTTEIRRLMQAVQGSYYCLYFEANVEANARQLDLEDLLLVLTRKLFQETKNLNFKLDPGFIKKIEDWFGIITQTTAVGLSFKTEIEGSIKAGAKLDYLGELQGRFASLIKFESEHRDELKTVLRKYGGSLLELVNQLLDAVRGHMEKDQRKLLIIVDNLDRYDPEQMDRLLIRQGDSLTRLRCNLLLTPPIALVYRPNTGRLKDHYRTEVMHSVRLRDSTDPYDTVKDPARRLLLETLSKRVDLDRLIPDAATRDRLLVASGGAMRELLELVLDVSLDSNDGTIGLKEVEKGISRLKAEMRDTINLSGWVSVLAHIGMNKQVFEGGACMDILYHRFAFHYNGSGWYDIHPLIDELPEYQKAKIAAEKQRPIVAS